MKFEEALVELKKGNKIKRVDDGQNYCLELDDFECGYELGLAELNGEWEVIEQILKPIEKDLLSTQTSVLKWFNKKVISISKHKLVWSEDKAFLEIQLRDLKTDLFETFETPIFNAEEKFVGMKPNADYTLEGLGI